MPKLVNGHKAPEQSPDFKMTTQLLNDFRDLWVEEFKKSNTDAVVFTRLSIVALTQLAAVLAVDVGMQRDQFSAVCGAQFAEAYRRAPKFGE